MADGQFDDDSEETGPRVSPVEVLQFATRCTRKHWRAALGVFLVIGGLGVGVSRIIPVKYEARTRMLFAAEGIRSRVLENGPLPYRGAELTGARERVFSQGNIRGVVEDAELPKLWVQHRPAHLKMLDDWRGTGLDRLPLAQQVRTLMGMVEYAIGFDIDQSSTVTIAATWSDPETALRLVEVTRKRFLADRLQDEIDVFQQVLEILKEQEAASAREVERLLVDVERAGYVQPPPPTPGTETSAATPAERQAVAVTVKEPGTVDPEVIVRLEKVRQKIREVQDPWQRRLADLKLQLSDLSASYGPKHPLVVNQEARIAEASVPPQALADLEAEEGRLVQEVEQMQAPQEKTVVRRGGGGGSQKATPSGPIRVEQSATLSAEQSKLIQAINKYNELSARVRKTSVELSTAEVSFRFRYRVTMEPELPQRPVNGKIRTIVAGGALGFGALLAFILGAILELAKGRIVAPWQVKALGLPVLAEIPMGDEADQPL